MQNDSVGKIISRYFATLTKVPFTFKEIRYDPKPLRVSPLLLRDYTCPIDCGGCCFEFTLDYLPSEEKPDGVEKRMVEFDGRLVEIWTDFQKSNGTGRCRHLRKTDGRCSIYPVRPFTCDFELIRTLQSEDPATPNTLTQKLFGRGWSYPRVDGGKGALCEMTPVTIKSITEVVRKLKRMQEWADHFKLETWTPELIHLVERGRFFEPITFSIEKRGFGL